MKRIGVWLMIGLLGLSLVYLLKPRPKEKKPEVEAQPLTPPAQASTPLEERLNINTASAQELESLPGIGPVTAERIVEYREKHGLFVRPEDLMIVEGIGEKKYRALADFIGVE